MVQLLIKGIVAGAIVVAAGEAAKRSPVLGAVIVSLPLTSMIALAYLWLDTGSVDEVSSLSWAILLVVLPSVVFFVALPLLLRAGVPFWAAMAGSAAILAASYALYAGGLGRLGIEL